MLTESGSNGYSEPMKSQVRIIGGEWRGRKLAVVEAEGLRPTPDRIRETLFNWLAADCRGATVLDCCAGSGALGLEALSRGARHLVALEQDRRALANLREQAEAFGCSNIEIMAGDARQSIARLALQFDLVFIDPPYAAAGLRGELFRQLEARGRLSDGARIYFEWPKNEAFELPSERLQWLKRKSAGQVQYAIAEWRLSR